MTLPKGFGSRGICPKCREYLYHGDSCNNPRCIGIKEQPNNQKKYTVILFVVGALLTLLLI